jgi:hypothetical protein
MHVFRLVTPSLTEGACIDCAKQRDGQGTCQPVVRLNFTGNFTLRLCDRCAWVLFERLGEVLPRRTRPYDRT